MADESSAADTKRRQGRLMARLLWALGLMVSAGVFMFLFVEIQRSRESATAARSQSPLNQLHLAFHNYHGAYGCFPPAFVTDEAGNRMHSWRALILPFVEANDVYKLYDFSEPWNGPNNSKLANRMPGILHCDSEPYSTTHTNFVVLVGPDTAFPGPNSTSLADFEDGPNHTILLGEIAHSNIAWLEPRDLEIDSMSFVPNDPAKPSLSSSRREGPYVLFVGNLRVHAVTSGLAPDVFRALTTIRGNEPIFMADIDGATRGLVGPIAGGATDADLARFRDWKKVHDLWLNRSPITDAGLVHLREAPHLHKLYLSQTPITDAGLKHFAGRKYLYLLSLYGTAITDAGLPHLAGLVEMDFLDLRDTQVTSAGVAKLRPPLPSTSVRFAQGGFSGGYLYLTNASVTEADLEHFRGRPFVWQLDLSGTQIGDRGLEVLSSWPTMHTLDLSRTAITDRGLAHLTTLSLMRDLKLADTAIGSEGLKHLSRMGELIDLDLSGTKIDDDGLRHLRGLTKLWHLDLSQTGISGKGLADLSSLSELRSLSLRETDVNDEDLPLLEGLKQLYLLHVNGTHVTEAGIADLNRSLPNLKISN